MLRVPRSVTWPKIMTSSGHAHLLWVHQLTMRSPHIYDPNTIGSSSISGVSILHDVRVFKTYISRRILYWHLYNFLPQNSINNCKKTIQFMKLCKSHTCRTADISLLCPIAVRSSSCTLLQASSLCRPSWLLFDLIVLGLNFHQLRVTVIPVVSD